jgi:hypothetical protein
MDFSFHFFAIFAFATVICCSSPSASPIEEFSSILVTSGNFETFAGTSGTLYLTFSPFLLY